MLLNTQEYRWPVELDCCIIKDDKYHCQSYPLRSSLPTKPTSSHGVLTVRVLPYSSTSTDIGTKSWSQVRWKTSPQRLDQRISYKVMDIWLALQLVWSANYNNQKIVTKTYTFNPEIFFILSLLVVNCTIHCWAKFSFLPISESNCQ